MFDQMEAALVDLGNQIAYPPTPTFRVPNAPANAPARKLWPAWVAASLAVVIVLLPGPRSAIADFLGIGAVEVSVVEDLPFASELREPSGDETTFQEARDAIGFELLEIEKQPDAVYLDSNVPGGMVSLVYGTTSQGHQLLITQVEAVTDEGLLRKFVTPQTPVMIVEVAGEIAFWIEGDPHVVAMVDSAGSVIEDSARLAGNTLLMTRDGVTVRLEGDMTLDQALSIAEQLR